MFSELISGDNKYEQYDFFQASEKCIAVANFFINDALTKALPITRKKVIKLTFLAQGFALATLDKSLYPDTIETWPQGPVIPGLYFNLKNSNPVLIENVLSTEYVLDKETRQLLHAVNNKYGQYNADQLSILTHKPNTPWSIAKNSMEKTINEKSIKTYYKNLLA